MASDPLIWTPSAVKVELTRILGVLDTVNREVSAASSAGKISGAEWEQWRQTYLAGHTFVTNASTFWGSNVVTARQHEQEAGKWRALVISRGGQTQGPSNLVRVPDSSSPFSINLSTIALVVGGGALTLYLMSLARRVAPVRMAGALTGSGGGVDLKNLWGGGNEPALRKAFSWLTRTGAGRHFPGMPIGWYQQHQIAAIDALLDRAKAKGVSDPRLFRTKGGTFYAKSGGRWVDLEWGPRQLFEIADKKSR